MWRHMAGLRRTWPACAARARGVLWPALPPVAAVSRRRVQHRPHATFAVSQPPARTFDMEDATFAAVCSSLSEFISRDVGRRGIAHITLPDQLRPAALAFAQAQSVVVLTGFPCRVNDSPPTETDGPPGAVALARAALALGKRVALVSDDCNAAVVRACAAAMGLTEQGCPEFAMHFFPPSGDWRPIHHAQLATLAATYEHTVAIERATSSALDGEPRTMRGHSMLSLVATQLDALATLGCAHSGHCYRGPAVTIGELTSIQAAGAPYPQPPAHCPTRSSTGIGDGGNELGMGRVKSAVRAHIPNGECIAANTGTDHLITAAVSNWGGWALVAAVEALLRRAVAGGAGLDGDWGGGRSGGGAGGGSDSEDAPRSADTITAQGQGAHFPPAALDWVRAHGSSVGSLLPSSGEETTLCAAMAAAGARDGISGHILPAGSVDGMPLAEQLAALEFLRGCVHQVPAFVAPPRT